MSSNYSVGEFDPGSLALQRNLLIVGANSQEVSLTFSKATDSLYVMADHEVINGFIVRVDPGAFAIAAQEIFPFALSDAAVSTDGTSVYLAAPYAKDIPVLDGVTLVPKTKTSAADDTTSVVSGPY